MDINNINSVEVFSNFLEKYKGFKELPEQYKSIKFCKLYLKIYNYVLNILKCSKHLDVSYIFKHIISKFIKAKDFYNWRNRIYSLLTEKLVSTSKRKYKLLYGSKWEEFYNKTSKIKEINSLKKWKVKNPAQSNIIKEKQKTTWNSKTPEEKEQIEDKRKATCLEKYGKKYVSQVKEINERQIITKKEKYGEHFELISEKISISLKNKTQEEKEQRSQNISNSLKNRTKEEKEQSRKKRNQTCLIKYNKSYIGGWADKNYNIGNHSKECDELCKYIDNILGNTNSEDTYYAVKNGEFYLVRKNSKKYYYDYVNTKFKFIVEFDGVYWHGLLEGQEYVKGIPVEEVWKRDKEKEELAIQNGYKVFHVRSDEYSNNKSKCLENLLKEIKNYVHSLENRI